MIRSCVLIVFYLITFGLNSQNFYVSDGTGSDTNDGSELSPFKTINKAILEVEHYPYAISQLAQTTMRNIVGEVELDDLLAKRDKVALKIKDIVDKETDPWGIKVNSVELKDIVLPEEMKRVIGKQAEAERERRAVITKAEGEAQAATNMSKAAKTLALAPGALHLRTLQSLNDISSDKSNTIIFAIPLEILKAFEGMTNKKK